MGSHTIPYTLEIHGAAKHTDITREIFLPANEGFVHTGTPFFVLRYAVVLGGANLDEPSIFFAMKVPDGFVSFTKVEAVWWSAAAAGNMYWRLQARYAAGGEASDIHHDSPAFGVTATGGNKIVNVQEPVNALLLANLAPGDYLGMQFQRAGADVLDTLDEDVRFLGLLFTYVANQ